MARTVSGKCSLGGMYSHQQLARCAVVWKERCWGSYIPCGSGMNPGRWTIGMEQLACKWMHCQQMYVDWSTFNTEQGWWAVVSCLHPGISITIHWNRNIFGISIEDVFKKIIEWWPEHWVENVAFGVYIHNNSEVVWTQGDEQLALKWMHCQKKYVDCAPMKSWMSQENWNEAKEEEPEAHATQNKADL